MKNFNSILGGIGLLLVCNVSMAGGAGFVSNGDNDGPGSLRHALDSGASKLHIGAGVSTIKITEPLAYSGYKRLQIIGNKQTIDASGLVGDANILSVLNGVNVSISGLSFIGNANAVNEDSTNPTGGKGIFVNVPDDSEGVVRVKLKDVSVSRVGNHGIHISDCSLGDDCGGGSGGGGNGSAASIYLGLDNVVVHNVGFGRQDADGVRVDDRGDGDIYFNVKDSSFFNVGADGVELDEGNAGDVVVNVRNSKFYNNGEYCNLVSMFVGTPCDDDGDPDVDDGFDIDEAGDGRILARIQDTMVLNNFDEGLDFDEEDADGIQAVLKRVLAAGNQDEGVKMSEEDAGDLDVVIRRLTSVDNNGDSEGVELEEADDGNVRVVLTDSNMIGNGEEDFKVEQADEGEGTLKIRRSIMDGLDLEGVVDEI